MHKNKFESENTTMENGFSVEVAMQAPSAAALMELAGQNGVVLSMENAEALYAELHSAALSDKEMESVSSGRIMSTKTCPTCHSSAISIVMENGAPKVRCQNASCKALW